jgi:6-phosphogluconolactonase
MTTPTTFALTARSFAGLLLACATAGLALAWMPARAAAATVPVWIGTYTSGTSPGIHVYDFDTATGHFSRTPVQVQPAANPSWLTFAADGRFVYAVNENGPGQRDVVGRVTAYRVAPATGALTPINQVASLGSEPAHASVSADGRYLFVANYSVLPDPGGTLAVIPIRPDGGLQPVTQIKTHQASQVDPERQASPHVHASVSSPDGRYVFAADLGADKIFIYRFDPGVVEAPLSLASGQPFLALPPGSGPRHMVFAPDGKHMYVTLEMAAKVAVLDYDRGTLGIGQLLPLTPPSFHGKVGAGAIHFSPDGRFLDVLDRGEDNQLVTFAVAPESGALTFVARRTVEGREPREFAFDPSGRFLLVANQGSGQVVVFARDVATGSVGPRVDAIGIDQPADITFLPRTASRGR